MNGSSRLKVRGGKLIVIKVEYTDKIEAVQILGDFFLYPEEALHRIEECLVGMAAGSSAEALAESIASSAMENGVEMIGMTPRDIADAVVMAIK